MLREGKKCVIYVRVSTEMQVDGFSLDGQRSTLKRFADREGLIVENTYEDAGKSGKSIEGRPAFTKMLNDIENGLKIDYVLVYKLSRFGRNAADILNSLELLQSYDINLLATEEGIDSSQTSGKLLISVLSAVSEIERENILEQTMNGRKEKARQGGWNGGFAPYGYSLIQGELHIAEDEAEVIRKIFDLFTTTELGINGVAKELNLQGIKKKVRHNGKLERWTNSTIKRILDNPVYIGKIAFGRRSKKRVKGTRNQYHMVEQKDYILENGKHEAIISEEIWNKTRIKRQERGILQESRIGYVRTHLLSGLMRCPKCGGPMYAQKNSHTNIYGEYYEHFNYQCLNRNRQRGIVCDFNKTIRKEKVDFMVIQIVKNLITNEEFVERLKDKLKVKQDTTCLENEKKNYESKLNEILAIKENLEKKIDYLPLDTPHRQRVIEDMEKRLYSFYDIIVDLENKIKDVTLKIKGAKINTYSFDNLLNLLKNFESIFDNATPEEQKTLLMLLIKRIHMRENLSIKTIEFNFPITAKETLEMELELEKEPTPAPVIKPRKITYKMIQEYIQNKYGFKVHTAYIAEVKRSHGIRMYDAPNAVEQLKHPRPHPPLEKVQAIEDALREYKVID